MTPHEALTFVAGFGCGALAIGGGLVAILYAASRDTGADLARQAYNRRKGWRL